MLQLSLMKSMGLAIATTHTQAKFTLPKVVDKFVKRYPCYFQMHQCAPDESVEMAAKGEVDIALGLKQRKRRIQKCPATNGQEALLFPKGILWHQFLKLN